MDIVTITFNPAIDKNYTVDKLVPEHKLRCDNPLIEAGGGGINVSKGLKELGSPSLAVFFAGGRNGNHFHDLLKQEKIECHPIPIDEETRESLVIIDRSSKKEFRIVVEGPQIDELHFQKLIELLHTIKPEYMVASGSVPKGLPTDVYAKLAKEAKLLQSKFILDTSGEALKAALAAGIYLIKPNLKELSNLVGVETLQKNEAVNAALEIINKYNCAVVVVSMSAEGAALVTKDMQHFIPSPEVERNSTVGAGDSMVSGMVWALQQNKSLLEMACWGVACGTAATMNAGTKLFIKQDVEKLFAWINKKMDL